MTYSANYLYNWIKLPDNEKIATILLLIFFATSCQTDIEEPYTDPEEEEEEILSFDKNIFDLADEYGCCDTFYGPSLVVVSHESIDPDNPTNPDSESGEYIVTFANVACSGFPAGNDAPIYYQDGIDPSGGTTAGTVAESKVWPFVRAIKYANGVANVTGY